VKSRIKKTDKTKPVYIYGKHALREALTQRPLSVQKIFLSPQFDDEQLLQVITKSRISVFTLKTKELENEVGSETSHQGVIALIDPGQLMVPFASFIESLDMRTNPGLVVFDEVHDPQNVGSVIRSAAASRSGFSKSPETASS
jgi:tRNA G18 (ribose-2'-O)-methylase SpoU